MGHYNEPTLHLAFSVAGADGRTFKEHILAGEFSGEDLNGDDVIAYSELASMLIYGERNYKNCQG
jgi:hypothetical protein